MRDFPSCFGESGVQIADAASSSTSSAGTKGAGAQNLVTCLYQANFAARPCVISVTWSRSLMGQDLCFGVDDMFGSGQRIYIRTNKLKRSRS